MIDIFLFVLLPITIFVLVSIAVILKLYERDPINKKYLSSLYEYLKEDYPEISIVKNRILGKIGKYQLFIDPIYMAYGVASFNVSIKGEFPEHPIIMLSYPKLKHGISWQGDTLCKTVGIDTYRQEFKKTIIQLLEVADKLVNKNTNA